MDKLAPRPKSVARALIAGLVAWALVMQGLAFAASARIGGDALHFGTCSAEDDGPPRQEPHAACACCLPCRSGLVDGPSPIALAAPSPLPPAPIDEAADARMTRVVVATSPPGWIASWSQRAPPSSSSL
ncbi:MAG TPA: hypothetical protein VIG55_14385, partial [Methylosinus sp.]|jgi:hypothetical protein